MNIILNNQSHEVNSSTIQDLILEMSLETKGVAIALNNKVIPKANWDATPINEGDKIVIVSAVFGG
ncbi:MAG: sulfur carrier protein ThiS [Rikenellaceae bacterium]